MKICPFCQVENRDDTERCRSCGQALDPWAQMPLEESPEPTQPVRPAGSTQPLPPTPTPPAGDAQRPAGDQGVSGQYAPRRRPSGPYVPAQGPRIANPSAANPRQRVYVPNQGATGGGSGYPPSSPPTYASRPKPRSDRPWMILAGVLALLLLCMGGTVIWIITSSAAGGLGWAGSQISTQAAGIFGGSGTTSTPAPSATQVLPSPWPTFTIAPTFTSAPTFTPEPTALPTDTQVPAVEATPESSLERYLTAECAAALDNLERLSSAVTSNPGLPLDADWRSELTQSVGVVRSECGSLDRASPVPGIMTEAQQNLDNATQEFDEANRLFKEGVDEFNPGKIFEAGQHLAEATKFLNQALVELRKIGN